MSTRQQEFFGLYDYVPFFGVVEDRMDPLNLGRVRVRIYAWHTENKSLVPTESLPWAQVVTPIHNAAMSGIGYSATGLVEGSTVVGFFLDGKNAQQPIVTGSVPGISLSSSGQTNGGFQDPMGKYPLETDIPDTPKLAYDAYQEDSSWELRSDIIESVNTSDGNSWSQPNPRGGGESKYPYNHVYKSESGHVREYDDTEGAERIMEMHKSGSFYEILSDGTRVLKIVKDDYEITVGDKQVYVRGNCNITVDSNATLFVKGNLVERVSGNYDLYVERDYTIHSDVLIKGISKAEVDHISGEEEISGKSHVHKGSAGLGKGRTDPPED